MESKELQAEELEVLSSIYDGDNNFKQVSSSCFQYKIGDEDQSKSFLLEISWPEQYPNVIPTFNLDVFYNNKLVPEVKALIAKKLQNEAEIQIGTPMTYTLIEWAKDNAVELTSSQPEKTFSSDVSPAEEKNQVEMVSSSKKEKKPQLSKSQKRKLADKLDSRGEHPRGWDWVDVVKHLSQIGSKQDVTS